MLVTDRIPNDTLYQQLTPSLDKGDLQSLRLIGDAEAPGMIAHAVYSGFLAANQFGEPPSDDVPFRVEYNSFVSQ